MANVNKIYVERDGQVYDVEDSIARSQIASLQTYSLTEIDTGKKWIDGKPIYRKCFYSATNWVNDTIVGTIPVPDVVTEIRSLACATGRVWLQNYGTDTSGIHGDAVVRASSGEVVARRTGVFENNFPSCIIVEYTKATA